MALRLVFLWNQQLEIHHLPNHGDIEAHPALISYRREVEGGRAAVNILQKLPVRLRDVERISRPRS